MTFSERYARFYKRGDPTMGQLLRGVLRRIEEITPWPLIDGATNFWRLNKVSLAVLAVAMDLPLPGTAEWEALIAIERRSL